MRILKFNEFSINESESEVVAYEVPDVKNIMDDGYEISAESFLDTESTPPTGKILVIKDGDNSITISFCDRFGKMDNELNISKDSVKITKNSDDGYTIKVDPNLRWLNTGNNRDNLEDFIEEFVNCKMDTETYGTRLKDGIKDDVYFIMDAMGIPCEVTEFQKLEDDNKYEVTLDNGMVIDAKKRTSDDLVGNFDIYKKHSDIYPSVSIKSDSGKMLFTFKPEEMDPVEIESNITEIGKDDYLNYLLKKSLGVDSTIDEERLYNHFVKSIEDHGEYSDDDGDEMQERGRASAKRIKDLKKLISSFLPESKIREIYPDKN
jgi:hypothetical protein